MEGSIGTCVVNPNNREKFRCVCDPNYFWNNSRCRRERTFASVCTGVARDECYDDKEPASCTDTDFFGQDQPYDLRHPWVLNDQMCIPKHFYNYDGPNMLYEDPETHVPVHDDTVFDAVTGLEWQKYTPDTEFTYNQAVTYCADLDYGGHSDWRLPNLSEIFSIVEFGIDKVPLDTDYFPRPWSYTIWSSVSKASAKSSAYSVRLDSTTYINTSSKTQYPFYVRCVRGDALPESSFTTSVVNGSEVRIDSASGLMWHKTSESITWQNALNYCENLEYAGFSDWRLPNVVEALTLMYLPKGEVEHAYTWTSTTDAKDQDEAYYYYFSSSYQIMISQSKNYISGVYCVR